MCIYNSRILFFNDGLSEYITKSIETSNVSFFKVFAKNTRTPKKIKSLETIKFLNKILSDDSTNHTKYIHQGKCVLNFETIPKPKFLYNVKFFKIKQEDLQSRSDDTTYEQFLLTKSLFGVKIKNIDIQKSKIVKKIKEVYPMELRNILFNFAMKYMEFMDESEISQFNEVLKIDKGGLNDSLLLEYIMLKTKPPDELMEGNIVFVKLLKFVSATHPWLEVLNSNEV